MTAITIMTIKDEQEIEEQAGRGQKKYGRDEEKDAGGSAEKSFRGKQKKEEIKFVRMN